MKKPKCNTCENELAYIGEFGIRTGGRNGRWKMFLGDWADVNERLLDLVLYRCEKCGRIEFFDEDFKLSAK